MEGEREWEGGRELQKELQREGVEEIREGFEGGEDRGQGEDGEPERRERYFGLCG